MKKKSLTIFIFILLFSITSCSKKKVEFGKFLADYTPEELAEISSEDLDDLTLQENGTFSIYIDSLTSNPIIYPVYKELSDNPYFFHFNRSSNSLDIYDLTSRSLFKRLKYPKEGPLSIFGESFPSVISMDSIFILARSQSRLMLTDTSGIEKASFPISVGGKDINVNMVQPFNVANGKAVIAYQPPYYDPMLNDSANYIILNLKNQTIKRSQATRPKSVSMFPMRGSDAIPRVCFGHNGSIINFFGARPLIIKSNSHNERVDYYILRSKYFSEPYQEPKNDGRNVLEENEFMKDNYFMMHYDKYNNYYYLMCLLEEEPFDNDQNLKTVDEKSISIIIADTLFRKRGEILLPKEKFFRSMLVTRDGLLISNANPKNKSLYEDSLTYTLFKVVPKD